MSSLIQQIRQGKLWNFHGGIHPEENKRQSSQQAMIKPSLSPHYVVPVKQHIGQAAQLLVKVGENVSKGQALTHTNNPQELPIHAPTSGNIIAIEDRPINHPSGLLDLCVVIEADSLDKWGEKSPIVDFKAVEPAQLIKHIHQAGIAGLGGAGFPTNKKLQVSVDNTRILIINAAECEPYITADDRLMQEFADELMQGIEIIQHITKPDVTVIGIEDNKPEAIAALEIAAKDLDIVIRVIPTKYPSGGSKQLTQILTGREIPSDQHAASMGVLMHNVGTAFAIKRAIIDGEPLIDRVVTLTGKGFVQSRNVIAKIGTPIADLLTQFVDNASRKIDKLIIGGSLMGYTLPHADAPVIKTTNCILLPTKGELTDASQEMPCTRCGDCAQVCPAHLLPQQLLWYSKAGDHDKCQDYDLFDCIECGACAYVCPSDIPLVHYYRQAKAEIRSRQEEARLAELARQRFEDRQARLEREKQARAERFKVAAEKRRQDMKESGGEDAIAAAIARVKAQKEGKQGLAPKEKATETSAPTEKVAEKQTKPAVAAAIARAKAKREAEKAQASGSKVADSKTTELETKETVSEPEKPKNPAVAAAIARAKAKREAAKEQASGDETLEEATETISEPSKPKNPAVAAAIARAKTKREAAKNPSAEIINEQPASETDTNTKTETEKLEQEPNQPQKNIDDLLDIPVFVKPQTSRKKD